MMDIKPKDSEKNVEKIAGCIPILKMVGTNPYLFLKKNILLKVSQD